MSLKEMLKLKMKVKHYVVLAFIGLVVITTIAITKYQSEKELLPYSDNIQQIYA